MDREMLYFKMQMLKAEIEMHGMIAENEERAFEEESPSYIKKDFDSLIDKYSIHENVFPTYKG